MIVRILILFTIVILVITVNFFSPNRQTRAMEFDLAYIAENCAGLTNEQAENIGKFIEPIGAFAGTDYYLFELSPDGTPQNHSLIALRDDHQEALCFPVVGCLWPLYFRGICLAS
ncbi:MULTISPECIES: hypothetical protein [unclassified Octadecabacter]|uniref:hypothetical protein n=1 Tax=unclassified Octadecabacter TaxID=196158 RepID=UPI001C0A5989|nr:MULTISPECIES: hypothetical protein [unclassified Octadecabacter]MBU2991669.1 hypothetical protein [Octadecabacter sp. B2R22]